VVNLTHGGTPTYMRGGPGFRGTLANVDVSSDASIEHINIDKSPQLHARVVVEVLAALLGKSRRSSGASISAIPFLGRALVIADDGSRQKADNPAPPPHKPPPGTQPVQIPN
jgi:hypothetical protein